MKFYLDSNDWEADYFIFLEQYRKFAGAYEVGCVKLDVFCIELPSNVAAGVILAEMKIKQGGAMVFEDTRIYGVPDFKQVFSGPAAGVKAAA